jgi:hypothetical protein
MVEAHHFIIFTDHSRFPPHPRQVFASPIQPPRPHCSILHGYPLHLVRLPLCISSCVKVFHCYSFSAH